MLGTQPLLQHPAMFLPPAVARGETGLGLVTGTVTELYIS